MLREYMAMGGWMMWPLLGCSVLLLAVLIERAWVVIWRGRVRRLDLTDGQRAWHRRALPFFVDVPPSLGLIGTIIGVVQCFSLTSGGPTGADVGAGLATACMTTLFGLGIAVVASVAGHMLDWMLARAELSTGAAR